MKYTIRVILMIGVATGALALADNGLYAQGGDPNAAPNPHKMQESWAQLPNGQKFGAAIKVQVDHSDGKSLWVFDRCGASECTDTTIPPIEKFDFSGTFQKAFGAGMFAVPHGLYVDNDGNVWAGDQIAGTARARILSSSVPMAKC